MKKIICIILAIISVVCLGTLTACKNTNKPKTSSYSEQKTNSQSEQKTISQSEKKDCSHEYEETVINATCLTDGKTTYTCKKCGNTYDVVIPALQHHNVIVKTDEATCDKSKVNYYECDRDGCDYAYTETVGEPLGHLSDGIKQETTPVSCDADGYTTYHCSRCNQDYIADVVKTEGHKIEKQSTITATCDSVGYDLMKCANCDYTEKVNFVANPQHDFEDGICKNCGKSVKTALPFSSNVSNGIYAVHKDSMYEVYAPAYSENTIVIPYYMLVALQQNEIYSFSLSMGANNGKYGLSLQCVINGENTYGLNCSSNEIKSVTTYTFADSDGVFDILEDTGIELAVYYRVLDYINEEDGSGLVDHYCIKLSYLEKFDIENPLTWTDKSEGVTYSYDEKYKEHYLTFTGYESGSKIKLRKEFLAYLFNNEYTQFTVQVGSKMSAGQRLSIDASTTAGDRLFGNLGTGIGSYSVATYYQNDFEITVSYTDLYGVQGWDATSAADGFNIYITTIPCLIKEPELPEFDLDNPLTWTDKSEGVTYLFDTKWQEHNLIFTGYESGSTIKLRKELLTALKESGSTKFTVQIGCKASAGQRISVGAVTTGGNIAAANLGTSVLTFNVADYYQNDFEITVSYTDLYGVQGWDATSAADGFVIYITYDEPALPEFDLDDPLTWTDKTKDVTYLFDTKWQEHNLIFTGYESGTTIKLRKELLTALKELGSTKFTVQIGSKASAGQHISINASTTAEDTLFGNGGTNVGTYSLATYYQNDFEITVIFTDNYGTAWNPTNEADGFVIYITYDEPALPEFDLDDPLTWTDKTKDVTYLFDTKWQEHNLIFTGYESGTKIKLRKELLKALKELGSTKFTVQIGCKASDGQRISVGAVTTGGNIATANLGTSVLTLNLADYYQADFEITVTYTDLYPNWPDGTSAADGFVIYFTYDEPALPEFDIDDPLTWIDKSEGVSYLFDTKWQEHNLIFTGYESGTTIKLRKELLAYLNTNGYTQFTVQIGCKASAGQRISVGAVTTGGNIAAANLGTATITYNVADYYQADFEITVTYTDLYPNWPDGTSAADGFVIYFTYSKSN